LQTLPQVPQFFLSAFVLTQRPPWPASSAPQLVKLPGHLHSPAWQISPALHEWPQLPQFLGFEDVFWQTGGSPHAIVPVGHAHAPF
jgi:hypothetical protein